MSEVISESPHTTSRRWDPHIGGDEPFPPDKLLAQRPRTILRQIPLHQQRTPLHHLDALSVAFFSSPARNVWGVTYAIYNYTCLEGELSIYTLSSLFIFLSTFWSVEVLVKFKRMLNIVYTVNRPWWVSTYDSLVTKLTTKMSAMIVFHGTVFIIVMVIPLVVRFHNVSFGKH